MICFNALNRARDGSVLNGTSTARVEFDPVIRVRKLEARRGAGVESRLKLRAQGMHLL